MCTPMWCRWAHPHSEPSRNSFIRPSEWPHSSPSPQLVTLRLRRGPRTNFSLFPLPDLPRTTHLSHASLLFGSMWWLKLQASSLSANYPRLNWNQTDIAVFVYLEECKIKQTLYDTLLESSDIYLTHTHKKNDHSYSEIFLNILCSSL